MFSWSVAFLPLLLSFSLIPSIYSQDAPTACYFLGGRLTRTDYRCDNSTTGHSTCCGAGAICYSNGVCQQSNVGVQDYLRVACTDPTFNDPACLQQCESFAPNRSAGIRFCNGAITSTNQYCCDNGTFGVGSFRCCDDPVSIFRINPVATVLAQIPLNPTTSSSSTTSTTSSSSTTSSPQTTTSAPPSSPTSTDTSSSGTNLGVAIGAGVGVPVGVIALGVLGYFLWRRRARKQQAVELQSNPNSGSPGYPNQYQNGYGTQGPQEMDPVGVVGRGGKKGFFGGRTYEAAPQEMPNSQREQVHELGS